ncbi:MAG TPA: hypothetical protein VHE35_07095 [Kofleriaceae bacterium]|nr:hypothetical protein [Kofleriaceae bacterium]
MTTTRPRTGGALLAALAAAWATAALVSASCGGAQAPAHETVAPGRPQTWPVSPDAAHARIETLDREIADRSASLDASMTGPRTTVIEPGTNHEPGTSPVEPPTPTPTPVPMSDVEGTARATCERSPRPVCQDVCNLSDSICDAAAEICQLAGSLPGDAWAAGRCDAGKGSCATSRERCCHC